MSQRHKAKLLVVDDQPANIQILAEALQGQYDVRIANNGEKALKIAYDTIKPDLILLDVMMPDLSGFDVCRRLKSNASTRHIPVIFVTAKTDAKDEEWGLNLGAVDYISKPFSIPVVRARVRNHLLLKQRADMLEALASIDPLTHLANRRQLEGKLKDEWKRAKRDGTELSLLLIDVDHFKNYNDHYGHGAGDFCLQRIAHALQSFEYRPGDLIARYGGEEFLVVLPNTPSLGAKATAERLCEQVRQLQLPHAYSDATDIVSISIGCATCRPIQGDTDINGLIDAADQQLYKAKQAGRNRAE